MILIKIHPHPSIYALSRSAGEAALRPTGFVLMKFKMRIPAMRPSNLGPISFCAVMWLASCQAFAHGNVRCPEHPKAEWQAQDQLQQKLQSEGWQVRKIETTKHCFEVYAKDSQGKKVEAFFDPKTLERVKN